MRHACFVFSESKECSGWISFIYGDGGEDENDISIYSESSSRYENETPGSIDPVRTERSREGLLTGAMPNVGRIAAFNSLSRQCDRWSVRFEQIDNLFSQTGHLDENTSGNSLVGLHRTHLYSKRIDRKERTIHEDLDKRKGRNARKNYLRNDRPGVASVASCCCCCFLIVVVVLFVTLNCP